MIRSENKQPITGEAMTGRLVGDKKSKIYTKNFKTCMEIYQIPMLQKN